MVGMWSDCGWYVVGTWSVTWAICCRRVVGKVVDTVVGLLGRYVVGKLSKVVGRKLSVPSLLQLTVQSVFD